MLACRSFNFDLRASDRCLQEKRKTITGDDILCAMATLGFDNYIEPLRIYLQNYREVRLILFILNPVYCIYMYIYAVYKGRQDN